MDKTFDCVVCGSCVADVLVRPVSLDAPIGKGTLLRTEPIEATIGGIVSNAGTALARFGQRAAAFTYVGDDEWGELIRRRYQREAIDTTSLFNHPDAPTSTTAVLVDSSGERSFLHCVGAPKRLDRTLFLDHLDVFRQSRAMLLGYYPLMPNLQADLPEVFAAIRATGCLTAMDASGDGGGMEPLDRILPHLDFYVPSHGEAAHQTGETEPGRILATYRAAGARDDTVLGVKLGARGALLSPRPGELIDVAAVSPPGKVLDTTGAGDVFYAGLLAGVLRGLSLADAGRLGAAAGAWCITGVGATTALRDYGATARLAGLV